MAERTDRRHFLGSAIVGTAGASALLSLEEKSLQAALDKKDQPAEPHRLPYQGETLPSGKLGKLTVGRLLMGGNLIGGYAHSRDLLYVSRLLREYNTDSRIFDTFELAEESGVNMIQVAPGSVDIVARYRKERGGKLQMMVCVDVDQSEPEKVKAQVARTGRQGGRNAVHAWRTNGSPGDGRQD